MMQKFIIRGTTKEKSAKRVMEYILNNVPVAEQSPQLIQKDTEFLMTEAGAYYVTNTLPNERSVRFKYSGNYYTKYTVETPRGYQRILVPRK